MRRLCFGRGAWRQELLRQETAERTEESDAHSHDDPFAHFLRRKTGR